MINKTWSNILNHLYVKEHIITSLYHYDYFLDYRNRRKQLFRKKRQLIFFMDNCSPHYLKHDCEISRYYQDILSLYDVRAEFLRLSRVYRSYAYIPNTADEFRKLSKVYRTIRH